MPDLDRKALATEHARAWLHAYGIRTERYTASGGDHPAMDTLPDAFLAFAAAFRDDAGAEMREQAASFCEEFAVRGRAVVEADHARSDHLEAIAAGGSVGAAQILAAAIRALPLRPASETDDVGEH